MDPEGNEVDGQEEYFKWEKWTKREKWRMGEVATLNQKIKKGEMREDFYFSTVKHDNNTSAGDQYHELSDQCSCDSSCFHIWCDKLIDSVLSFFKCSFVQLWSNQSISERWT